ncbi:MAG: peptidoglycan editing factor PgeF [Holosporales bacterium]|jgi:YfiH family protein|nr:peptidoglycan editing factor PgeF [Holosporales bacterium]
MSAHDTAGGLSAFKSPKIKSECHGFFTKGTPSCNVAFNRGDPADAVLANRERIKSFFSPKATSIVFTEQAHTNVVRVITNVPTEDPSTISDQYDAIVTHCPGVLIGVYTADCVPVLLYSESVIGVIHCGWKGLKAKIIGNVLKTMNNFGATNIVAAIGPCIRKKNYVVDESFLEHFPSEDCNAEMLNGELHVDLPSIARAQLHELTNVTDIEIDTYDNPNLFFSYRRHLQAGHQTLPKAQASVLML